MIGIKNFFVYSKEKEKEAYVWNSVSAILNSFQSVVILMVISRIDNINDAGTFVIAYAIANLMIMIGKYGIRHYQVSDIKEKFSFKTYFVHRITTTIMMILVAVIYVSFFMLRGEYDLNKSIVVILICAIKAVDAFEDVFHGMFQQHARLDIGGKILSFRLFIYIVEFMVVYYFSHRLIFTGLICLITTLCLMIVLNTMALKEFPFERGDIDRGQFKSLCVDCFPLFISTFLMAYVGNAPKYSIDVVLSSQEQAQFNYIFMPVFVISLMSTFIYQPMINRLAIIWNKNQFSKFWKLIFRQIVIILGLTAASMGGGYLLGIPVMSLLYSVDLSAYRIELTILLLGGGMLALVNFFTMVITVTRYQKYLIWGYIVISAAFVLRGKTTAATYGIEGISIFYTAAMFVLALIFFIYIIVISRISDERKK